MKILIKIAIIVLFSTGAVSSQLSAAEDKVLPYWQEQMDSIGTNLDNIRTLYQKGDKKTALELSKSVHFSRYRNSDLEATIRTNYSMPYAEEINQRFFELSRLINEDGDHSKKIDTLLDNIKADIGKVLPSLPLTPRLIREQQTILAQKEAERIENKNYSEDVKALNAALHQALVRYQEGQTDAALQLIREGFYQHWQTSDLGISLSPAYRQSIEHSFDSLYKNIQQQQAATEVEQQIESIKKALQKTKQHKIKATQKTNRQWKFLALCVAGLVVLLWLIAAARRYSKVT
ncbi:MAG: hypothetical protein CSA45_00735 [Gammaproteobacteria bacterium]|nr:MAG: hypothetical protein CSA45_00735 [Gammaproteobacteria bacterium]